MLKKSLFLIGIIHGLIVARDYLYPVAVVDEQTMLVLYQKNIHHTELFFYNVQNHVAHQALFFMYNPAAIAVSPHKKGFLFIDNGSLKYKDFAKRSPASFAFDKPLYNFHTVCWRDDTSAFFSAQCGNGTFELFAIDLPEKRIHSVISMPDVDTMFPWVADERLYLIERDKQQSFSIVSYQLHTHTQEVANREIVYESGRQPIAFLLNNPHSDTLFFIEHPADISRKRILKLKLVMLSYVADSWIKKELFDFSLPLEILYKEENGLAESVLPLLPRIYKDFIVFCDQSLQETTSIYRYAFADESISLLKKASWHQYLFTPFMIGDTFLIGGNCTEDIRLITHEDDSIRINFLAHAAHSFSPVDKLDKSYIQSIKHSCYSN